jgi:TRAP-type C4-dicarboxylate transport system substrate-binding protein
MPIKRACVLLLASVAVTGCAAAGAGGDKAGGRSGGGPLVLRLANTSYSLTDVPPVAYFVRRVEQLSHGTIQIRVGNDWASYAPDAEAQVVRAVASGIVDLGWAGSRVFDSIGVSSFRALSAPMLIDSYPLEQAVLASTISDQMLAGLRRVGVAGLGLLGDALRVPISVHRPLLRPEDWRGVEFGTLRSGVQEEVVRGLGAVPVEAFGVYRDRYLESGKLQAFELDLPRYVRDVGATKAPFVTVNIHLWPQIDVLIANPRRLSSLSDQQRAWLKQAAADAAGRSVALADDAEYLKQACLMGARFYNATGAELTAMRRALSVVYQQLEQNPQTDAFIREIETLKRHTPPGPAFRIPQGCSRGP